MQLEAPAGGKCRHRPRNSHPEGAGAVQGSIAAERSEGTLDSAEQSGMIGSTMEPYGDVFISHGKPGRAQLRTLRRQIRKLYGRNYIPLTTATSTISMGDVLKRRNNIFP